MWKEGTMKKAVITLTLIFSVLLFSNVMIVNANELNEVHISNSYLWDISNEDLRNEKYEISLIIQIDKQIKTKSTGTFEEAPSSVYRATVIHDINNNFDMKRVNFSILGGIADNEIFYVTNGYSNNPYEYLPQNDMYYLISFSSSDLESDGYEIKIPEYLIYLKNFNETTFSENEELGYNDFILESYPNSIVDESTTQEEPNTPVLMSVPEEVTDPGGGGGGGTLPGSSFDDAIELVEGVPQTHNLDYEEDIYFYYITESETDRKIIESSYVNGNTIDLVANHYTHGLTNIGTDNNSGVGYNFKLLHWTKTIDKYFVKVSGNTIQTHGSFSIELSIDPNCDCINDVDDLTDNAPGINGSNEYKYYYENSVNDTMKVFLIFLFKHGRMKDTSLTLNYHQTQ